MKSISSAESTNKLHVMQTFKKCGEFAFVIKTAVLKRKKEGDKLFQKLGLDDTHESKIPITARVCLACLGHSCHLLSLLDNTSGFGPLNSQTFSSKDFY